MTFPSLTTLPAWLVLGFGLGGLLSLLVAAVFVVGSRRFPGETGSAEGRASGEYKRRTEIRDYLRRIDEPFSEDVRVEGHDVEFHLTDRDVAITFDPRTYFALERGGRSAVLVEHELPGWRIGTRLPFDTPTVPALDPDVMTAFDVLGVPADASVTEVRAAYRERIKAAHPDHGGDRDAFERVREAYTVAVKQAG